MAVTEARLPLPRRSNGGVWNADQLSDCRSFPALSLKLADLHRRERRRLLIGSFFPLVSEKLYTLYPSESFNWIPRPTFSSRNPAAWTLYE